MKLYLSYEFFSYDRHDRYNDMETRRKQHCLRLLRDESVALSE